MSGSNVWCPRPGCGKEMIWQNDYDLGLEDDDGTYTDLVCRCGAFVTIPWQREDEEEEE